MKHTKTITILHSNDLHGDFLSPAVKSGLLSNFPPNQPVISCSTTAMDFSFAASSSTYPFLLMMYRRRAPR